MVPDRLKVFAAEKEKQAEKEASGAGEKIPSETRSFFEAGKKGDSDKVFAMFHDFANRKPPAPGGAANGPLRKSYWAPIMEIDLAYETVIPVAPKAVQIFADDTINSIPPGSIYFGGTDTGRGLITTFCKSQIDGDLFTITLWNALADLNYPDYL